MHKPWKLFLAVLVLAAAAIWIDWPGLSIHQKIGSVPVNVDLPASSLDLNIGGTGFQRDFPIKQGLDLQGGTELTLQVDMSQVKPADQQQALESDTEVIRKRVDAFGVSEPLVQSSKTGNDFRILVDLPGVKDVNQAVDLVGKTAKLEIRELTLPAPIPGDCAGVTLDNTKPTGITGADLTSASVTYPQGQQSAQNVGAPVVAFTLTDQGAKKFGDLTTRLVQQPLPIFLDDECVSNPKVNEPITGGKGQISGDFTTAKAKELATQLNAGALKAPVRILEQRTISATLGDLPVKRSLEAGILGLLIVALFMITYYGRYGVVAVAALTLYTLIVLSVFKIIPVTLTLAGIAGFILSVGMAVDANILIFERMREEFRAGKKPDVATELGFSRAWTSIRDSNLVTIVVSLILMKTTTGLVQGFALTLFFGVLTSMFTAVVVTRTFIRVWLKYEH